MKRLLNNLDVAIYHEKMASGLDVYVIPKPEASGIYATFTTHYGSIDREFVPYGETKMVTVPDGIAHFLEHKVFEQNHREDPFTFFGQNGSDCNANTSNYKTSYLFTGPDHLEENLIYLLDFVRDPYLTEENVEKEKGIIEQEIKMNQDNPAWQGFDGILANTFQKHPIRIPIAGTVESIYQITKKDLETCYKTFYRPENMFLVISGNVDAEATLALVRKHEENVEKDSYLPERSEYQEPDEVGVPFAKTEGNVTNHRIFIGYKFKLEDTGLTRDETYNYISLMTNLKFGGVSDFLEKMEQQKLVVDEIDYDLVYTNQHILLIISAETKNPELLSKKIKEEMLLDDLVESDFLRKRKTLLSSCIYMSDNFYRLNEKIMNDLILNGTVNYDLYGDIKALTFEKMMQVKKRISYNHVSEFWIEPKKNL